MGQDSAGRTASEGVSGNTQVLHAAGFCKHGTIDLRTCKALLDRSHSKLLARHGVSMRATDLSSK